MKQGKTGIRLTNGQVGFLLVVPGLAIFAGIILLSLIHIYPQACRVDR